MLAVHAAVSAWLFDCVLATARALAQTTSSLAFTRRVRLTTPADFQRTLKHGRRIHVELLMAVVHHSTAAMPRLGLAIVKRHVRRAHERNRIKRLAREVFRHEQISLPSVDCVLMVKAGVEQLTNSELRQQLTHLFQLVIRRCSAGC